MRQRMKRRRKPRIIGQASANYIRTLSKSPPPIVGKVLAFQPVNRLAHSGLKVRADEESNRLHVGEGVAQFREQHGGDFLR